MLKLSERPKANAGSAVLSAAQWSFTHFGNQSEIDVLVPSTGKWETAATVYSVAGLDAEDVAGYIILLVCDKTKTKLPVDIKISLW